MKLRTQLTTTFLACGLAPLLVAGVVSYRTASFGFETVTKDAAAALAASGVERLEALRESKKQQVEDYFSTVQKQVITFSANQMVIDAMRDLRSAFQDYPREAGFTEDDLKRMRSELTTFYRNEFGAKYAADNSGRSAEVRDYIDGLDEQSVALQYDYIKRNPHPLGSKHLLDRAPTETRYNAVHAKLQPVLRDYLTQFGYYDIFLVDAESGDVIYTTFKEIDFSASLAAGPLAETNFAKAVNECISADTRDHSVLVDFSQYLPSYDAPASFIASPIFDGDKKLGVAVFQMPLDQITRVMSNRAGLGETGEAILIGSDSLLRSDSHSDPVNRTVVNSYRNPQTLKIELAEIQPAFVENQSGVATALDYVGHEALMAYAPVKVLGLTWCIVCKVDTAELYSATAAMKQVASASNWSLLLWMMGVAAVVAVVVGVIAVMVSRSIANPVAAAAHFAQQIANGDLTRDCQVKAHAEVGELIAAMNVMRGSLTRIVGKLYCNASTLSRSSTSLSATATQLAGGADETTKLSSSVSAAAEEMSANITGVSASTEEMSQNVRTVAAAIEEMTASIAEVAENAERAAAVAEEATQLTAASSVKISHLGAAASEIGKVIEVIQDIAELTNLLALNATIEAARAGDAGKGFAVVATEVKELAKQTASATDDIRSRIEAIQAATSEAISAIGDIEAVIHNVNDFSRTIASAVEEQRITTTEIARSVAETTQAVESVTRSVSESAAASREITCNMSKVDLASRQTSDGAGMTRDAGDELLNLAEELQGLVKEFRVEAVATA